MIAVLGAQNGRQEAKNYSSLSLSTNSSQEEIITEWNESSWDDESDYENDELKKSFRDGLKRTASEEFYNDLKRIKFDNNVRDITNTLSVHLDFTINETKSTVESRARSKSNNHLLPEKSRGGEIKTTDEK